jgi:hypothetical protein
VGATTAACFSSEAVNAFLPDNRNHHQSGSRIHPPPTEQRIQPQANQENRGKVATEVGLSRIGVHRTAANLAGDTPFRSGQQRHDDHRNGGDHDACNASFRCNVPDQHGAGFVEDVQRQSNEARSDCPQRNSFDLLAPRNV